ncbi:MAG: hypothetical protein K0S45_3479 [Nitrospira sp.]|jgi:hypothetical protein|nr:hypothetical protein [Nitrospira sp.]
MKRYKNLSRNSGVVAYQTGPDFVKVQFSEGTVYVYDYASAGSHNIEHMKRLARKGLGLSSFISTTVREAFVRKEPLP